MKLIAQERTSPVLSPNCFLSLFWTLLAATVLATAASGCSAELASDDGATDDDDDGASESSDAVSAAGRWRPSPSAAAVGARVRVPYDSAPSWNPSLCAGGFTAGGKKVKEFLTKKFSEISSIQGYACRRNTAASGTMSVHGTGRALDIFIPQAGAQADNTKGDKVANYLVEHAQEMSIQFIIWDRSKWRANGTNDSPYGGPNPHIDHLHVEITEEAGRLGPAWYRGATGGGSVDEPVSANPIVRATVDTYIKVSVDDSATLSDGDKCRVAKGTELALERASTNGEHVSGSLKSKHSCGTKFVIGAKVFAYRDHFLSW